MQSCLAPQADGIGECARLLTDDGELAGVFRVLELGVGDAFAVEPRDEHGLLQQGRIAETGCAKDDPLRSIAPDRFYECTSVLPIGQVARGSLGALGEEGLD